MFFSRSPTPVDIPTWNVCNSAAPSKLRRQDTLEQFLNSDILAAFEEQPIELSPSSSMPSPIQFSNIAENTISFQHHLSELDEIFLWESPSSSVTDFWTHPTASTASTSPETSWLDFCGSPDDIDMTAGGHFAGPSAYVTAGLGLATSAESDAGAVEPLIFAPSLELPPATAVAPWLTVAEMHGQSSPHHAQHSSAGLDARHAERMSAASSAPPPARTSRLRSKADDTSIDYGARPSFDGPMVVGPMVVASEPRRAKMNAPSAADSYYPAAPSSRTHPRVDEEEWVPGARSSKPVRGRPAAGSSSTGSAQRTRARADDKATTSALSRKRKAPAYDDDSDSDAYCPNLTDSEEEDEFDAAPKQSTSRRTSDAKCASKKRKVSSSSSEDRIPCLTCHTSCARGHEYNRHMKTTVAHAERRGPEQFYGNICTRCAKIFVRKDLITRHHREETYYNCAPVDGVKAAAARCAEWKKWWAKDGNAISPEETAAKKPRKPKSRRS